MINNAEITKCDKICFLFFIQCHEKSMGIKLIDLNISSRALSSQYSTLAYSTKTEEAAAAYKSAALVKLFMFYLFLHNLIGTTSRKFCRTGRIDAL